MEAVERLPLPYWFVYLSLFVAELVLVHVLAWIDGAIPFPNFDWLIASYPIWLWGPLAAMTYLDRVALDSLDAFRPLLAADEELTELKRRFTTMSPRAVLVSSAFWSVFFLVLYLVTLPTLSVRYPLGPVGTVSAWVAGLASFGIGSAIYLHTIHQLRLVRRTVASVPRFNLFNLGPIYAFSRLTSRTAIAWLALLSLTMVALPEELNPAFRIGLWAIQGGLALAAFAVPLWSVHQRLVAEKRGLIADLDLHYQAAIARLHGRLDEDDAAKTSAAKDALLGLAAEREFIERIPTWPWRAGTLTAVVSAVVLPLLIFLAQDVLRHWLGW